MSYRKFKIGASILLLGAALFVSPVVLAQPGMEFFNEGVKAASAGDYRSALSHFQKARKAGLNIPALQFNFGVTYYRLGQYENARKVFVELSKIDSYRQLANYNLGLVANKQNKKSEAIAAFQQAYREGDSDKIKTLSGEALSRLGAKPKKPLMSANKWAGLASISLESDSNVALVNDDLVGVSSKSDTSMVLSAYGANWLTGDKNDGLRFFARGYLQNYSSETNYNYNQFGAGVARYDRPGSWNTRVGAFWDESYLGGSSYQRILTADVRGYKSITNSNQLRLLYKGSQITSTDTTYDYLQGTRHQLQAGMQAHSKSTRYRFYYELELNDRDDYSNPAATTYTFRSYSPTRQTLRVTGWWDLSSLWKLRLDGRYRTSKYKDDYVLASSATESRKDTQTRLSARLTRNLDKNMDLEMNYSVTNNDSSIDAESYDRNLLSVGVVRTF